MKKVFITGVSSGIGRALTKRMVNQEFKVWGVARRKGLLKNLAEELTRGNNFHYLITDISTYQSWKKIINQLKKSRFLPEIIIFNAAINDNDLEPQLSPEITRRIFNVNFFSVIDGVDSFLKLVNPGTQFIVISSLSAFKGSSVEGIGYGASKAAVSVAFESLTRKFGDKHIFKTIYLGPVASGMGPFKKRLPFILTELQAVDLIIKSLKGQQSIYYYPGLLFFLIKIVKLMPTNLYFLILSLIEYMHKRFEKKS